MPFSLPEVVSTSCTAGAHKPLSKEHVHIHGVHQCEKNESTSPGLDKVLGFCFPIIARKLVLQPEVGVDGNHQSIDEAAVPVS